jgi:hypothetical protein
MPTATISMRSGATIVIDGTDEEIVSVVARLENLGNGRDARSVRLARADAKTRSQPTLPSLLSEMIGDGFFKQPRHLGALKEHLEQKGHFYPLTTLSPAMLRLIRSRRLRRIKDDKGRWGYVG